jgi:hypothetical protein
MSLSYFLPHSFFLWCQHTRLGIWEANSLWAFAIIETVHILGLTVLLGTLLAVDLRLLGLGVRNLSAAQLSAELSPIILSSLVLMVCTGIPLFAYEALRLSTSRPFFVKMMFFLCAITLHFTLHRKTIVAGANDRVWLGKLSAYLSLFCWLGVAMAGRAIAFVR